MRELHCVHRGLRVPPPPGRPVLIVLLAALVGGLVLLMDRTPASAATYELRVSKHANRSSSTPLARTSVSGDVYVFLTPSTGVSRVRFYVDDPTKKDAPFRFEYNAPYDLAGASDDGLANPFDTGRLTAGSHVITAAVELAGGSTTTVSATFTTAVPPSLLLGQDAMTLTAGVNAEATARVDLNASTGTVTYAVSDTASWLTVSPITGATPATLTLTAVATGLALGTYSARVSASASGYTGDSLSVTFTVGGSSTGDHRLLFSTSADRSSARSLDGTSVSGNIFVFVEPATTAERVRWFLDDPTMKGSPSQVEGSAPYDFAGGTSTLANPFDTSKLDAGSHTFSAAIDATDGSTAVVTGLLTVVTGVSAVADWGTPSPSSTRVDIFGDRFYINEEVTHPAAAAEGLLMNVRMVNSVFEDEGRPSFDAEANANEFIAAMPDYVAHGVRGFTLSLQGGNPGYEGAVNSAFRSDGSLTPTYLARVTRVIQAADTLGAVVILSLFYQRQDQRLANDAAIRAGVVNVMEWLTQEGFSNVLVEIANEYPHPGFQHELIRTTNGMKSLIQLAKQTAPHLAVSASGLGGGVLAPDIALASDYLLIHFNTTEIADYDNRIAALRQYGKPIVVNEDPKTGSTGASAAQTAGQNGASWGFFLRANQDYPFTFRGAADDTTVYGRLRQLTTP